MWQHFKSPDRCWRCGKKIDPSDCDRHYLIPTTYGGVSERDNLAKLDPKCHIMVRRKMANLDDTNIESERNPFQCKECGVIGEVLKIQETAKEVILELRCKECRATYIVVFSAMPTEDLNKVYV